MNTIICLPERARYADKGSWAFPIVRWVLNRVLPRASPDYDRLLPQVSYWLIELDAAGQATREIGFNNQDIPIVWAPTDRNYGLWTDSNRVFKPDQLERRDGFPFDHTWNALKNKQENIGRTDRAGEEQHNQDALHRAGRVSGLSQRASDKIKDCFMPFC